MERERASAFVAIRRIVRANVSSERSSSARATNCVRRAKRFIFLDYFSKKKSDSCVSAHTVRRARGRRDGRRERGIENASDGGFDGVGDDGNARAMVRVDEGLAYDASRMVRTRERSLDDDERKRYRGDGDDGRF
jgi:hypothetical protein